jgi:hypothetical protein
MLACSNGFNLLKKTRMRLRSKHQDTGSGPFYADRQTGEQSPLCLMLHPLRHGLGQVRRTDERRTAIHNLCLGDRCTHHWLMVWIKNTRGYLWTPSLSAMFLSGEPSGASISQEYMTTRPLCEVRQLVARSCSETKAIPIVVHGMCSLISLHFDVLMVPAPDRLS